MIKISRLSSGEKILLMAFAMTAALLLVGLNSSLYLGDEVIHYRFAQKMFEEGKRLVYDPLYGSGRPPGYYYVMGPFWHAMLSLIWKLTGGVSFVVAQMYQAAYYAALVIFTFLLGRHLYDDDTALAGAFIAATVPMVVSFSILFYVDVPASAFGVLFFLLLFKERYWLAGLCAAVIYLTKRNACFLLPVAPLLIFVKYKKNVLKSLFSCVKLAIPGMVVITWDILWRMRNIGSIFKQPPAMHIPKRGLLGQMGFRESFIEDFFAGGGFDPGGAQNSVLLDPVDIVKYLGLALIVSMVLYLALRKFRAKDLFLWAPAACYILIFFYFFRLGADIRYLCPVVPFLCLIGGKALAGLDRKFVKSCVVGICVLQFIMTCGYVYAKRQLPPQEQEAFQYIRQNIPDGRFIMYPEPILMVASEKKVIWGSYKLWPYLFWGTDEERKLTIEMNDLHYIVVKHARIYDDARTRHCGGYPRSFVERLPEMDFAEVIYDNGAVSVWQIDRESTAAGPLKKK